MPAITYCLEWASREIVEVQLDEHADPDRTERVVYLPQRLIDDICNPEVTDSSHRFERELEKCSCLLMYPRSLVSVPRRCRSSRRCVARQLINGSHSRAASYPP